MINSNMKIKEIKEWSREGTQYNNRGVTLEESEILLCFEIFRTLNKYIDDELILSLVEDKFNTLIEMIKDTNIYCITKEHGYSLVKYNYNDTFQLFLDGKFVTEIKRESNFSGPFNDKDTRLIKETDEEFEKRAYKILERYQLKGL